MPASARAEIGNCCYVQYVPIAIASNHEARSRCLKPSSGDIPYLLFS